VPCSECSRLLADYERLKWAYVKAFDIMLATCYISSTEFTLAKGTADEARLDFEVGRLELANHERIHFRAN
jgi:hypothetical protein